LISQSPACSPAALAGFTVYPLQSHFDVFRLPPHFRFSSAKVFDRVPPEMARPGSKTSLNNSTANLGLEARLSPATANFYFGISPFDFHSADFIHHLAPHGMAGFVFANGSMSSNQPGEGTIRQALIEVDLVDCMVALPGQLFYSTQISICLWFLSKNKSRRAIEHGKHLSECFLDRNRETLFVDARRMGTLLDSRRHFPGRRAGSIIFGTDKEQIYLDN
jgi:hypothetical protein